MTQLVIKNEWSGLIKNLSRIKERKAVGMYRALEKVMIFLEARFKESVRNKLGRGTEVWGRKPGGPTGRLSSDWAHKIEFKGSQNNMTMEGRVGTPVIYAPVHEFGGKGGSPNKPGQPITPVRALALTIPFPGTAGKYPPARALYEQGLTYIAKLKGGQTSIIFLKNRNRTSKGNKRQDLPIYVLRKEAHIPARPFMKPVLDQFGKPIQDLLGDGWKAIIEGKD